ncbi:hypothetical protein QBZ16_004825 [Prototheca wickerhamii]|uniref:Uncharacterized protein n=1 Tax=Prototheca wickerhamii TaxID=3111 RepID=A0AAD9MMM7_PROWI|nr:hypothetical protein QBZ16_004825 [Prototheca wickerhamii]
MTDAQDAEMDALAALGALAEFASEQAKQEPDAEPAAPPATAGAPPKGADMQKWIQCSECEKWRKVPFNVSDTDIPDDWTCADNVWGMDTAVCGEDQAMSNDEIDYILSSQAPGGRGTSPRPTVAPARARPRGPAKAAPGRGAAEANGGAFNDQDEAAEALLGMLAFDGGAEAPGLPRGAGGARFPPGSVVWAKVEGHDWWPAVVVRRRAVPREVGPPPGGPATARSQIPVVFFKADGVPGSAPADEALGDTAVRLALRQDAAGGDDEAEYAWLPCEALRRFDPGAGPPANPDRPPGLPADPGLEDCVAAAEAAILADRAAADAIAEASSDSDGGWAAPARLDEGYEPYAASAAAAGDGAGRIVVEAILGWRWGRPDPAVPAADPAPEYLVKYGGRSHVHDEWVPEAVLLQIAKRKVLNFRKRAGASPCVLADPAWTRPERLVARRPAPGAPGWEILVKWEGLGYEAATWESEAEPLLCAPGMAPLHRDMWRRQEAALDRGPERLRLRDAEARRLVVKLLAEEGGIEGVRNGSRATVEEEGASASASGAVHASAPLVPSSALLSFVDELAGPPLAAHQLSAVAWLLRRWAARLPGGVLGDAPGMGKSVSALAFLEALRRAGSRRPSLLVVPASSLEAWEGEFRHWARPGDPEVLVYAGPFAARGTLLQSELWLRPGALEGRGLPAGPARLRHRSHTKPDVVLTTHEVLASDAADLADVPWGAVVFDDRERAGPFAVVIAGPASAEEPRGVLGLVDPAALAAIEEAEEELERRRELAEEEEDAAVDRVEGSGGHDTREEADAKGEQLSDAMDGAVDATGQPIIPNASSVSPPASPLAKLAEATLARDHGALSPCSVPGREVRVSVAPTEAQREAARLALARAYEALTDGRGGRRDGWRVGALRALLHDLRAVAVAPALAEEEEEEEAEHDGGSGEASREASFGPGASGGGAAAAKAAPAESALSVDALVATCAKLALLERLLRVARRAGLRLAVVAHDPRAGAGRAPGGGALPRTARRRWRWTRRPRPRWRRRPRLRGTSTAASSSRGSSSLHTRAAGLGTALHALDAVVLLDADPAGLSPSAPATEGTPELACAARLGNPATLRVLRLVTRCAAERVPLELAERAPRLAARLAAGNGARAGGAAALAADARAGAHRPRGGVGGESSSTVPDEEASKAPPPTPVARPHPALSSSEPPLTDAQLELLLVGGNRRPAVKGEDGGERAAAGPWPPATLQAVLGPTVSVHPTCAAPQPPPISAALESSGSATDGADAASAGSATEADLQALAEIVGPEAAATLDEGAGAEPGAHAATFWAATLEPTWRRLREEEARREEQRAAQLAGRAASLARERSDTYDASGDADDRRYADEADADGDPALLLEETGDVYDPEELAALGGARHAGVPKRARRGSRDGSAAPPPLAAPARPLSPETEALRAEWLRHEATMRAIADPTTPEAAIARAAADRVTDMARELGLPAPIVEIAHQAAEILLMMRPPGEAPSDFQEYTLVAVLAVAAHLSQHRLGERHGLVALAARYGQDADALEQVFEYIMQSLVAYRAMHVRVQQLAVEGVIRLTPGGDEDGDAGGALGGAHQAAVAASAGRAGDLDGFTGKLNAILAADLAPAALAAGPLDVGNNLVQQLGAMLAPEAPGGALPAEVDALLRNLRGIQEQVALLDRIQNLRVKNIQDEYQRFMERVRGKAQGAIDTANAAYSQQRTVLMTRFDALVNVLSQHQQSSQAAQRQQQQVAAAAAAARQQQSAYGLEAAAHEAGPVAGVVAVDPAAGTRVVEAEHPAGMPGSATAASAALQQQQLAAAANPSMNALSHAMATQFLTLQAGMAAQAAAAAAAAAGAKPSAAAAAVAAAAAAQHPFGALLAQAGHFSEPEIRAQLEQFEMLAKAGQLPPGAEQHIALLQAAMATAHAQAQAAAAAQQQQGAAAHQPHGGAQGSTPAHDRPPRSRSDSPASAEQPTLVEVVADAPEPALPAGPEQGHAAPEPPAALAVEAPVLPAQPPAPLQPVADEAGPSQADVVASQTASAPEPVPMEVNPAEPPPAPVEEAAPASFLALLGEGFPAGDAASQPSADAAQAPPASVGEAPALAAFAPSLAAPPPPPEPSLG